MHRRLVRWRLLRFNALTAVTSIAGSVMVTTFLVETVSMAPIVANAISVIVLGAVNFVGSDRFVFRTAALAALIVVAPSAQASEEAILKAKTASDFAKYVAAVEARRARDIADHEPFLDIERQPPAQLARTMATLKRGEVIVTRGVARDDSSNEVSIDGGLINHWRGTVFVPNVKLDATAEGAAGTADRQAQAGRRAVVARRLARRRFAEGVPAAAAHQVRDRGLRHRIRRRSTSGSRRIAPGATASRRRSSRSKTPARRASARCPKATIHGYMWRLNSYWRYKQLDDGVLVEIESLTLSRSLPAIIGR